MTRTLTLAYRASRHYRERIFAVLAGAIILTACSYIFLLQKAIVNVVQREKISTEITTASRGVGELEEQYFALKNNITLELAHARGLKDAETVSYISKKSLTAMASHNEL